MAISVEDVRAYKSFICEQFRDPDADEPPPFEKLSERHLQTFIERLVTEVHPLALGNVQRVLMQIQQLAKTFFVFIRLMMQTLKKSSDLSPHDFIRIRI